MHSALAAPHSSAAASGAAFPAALLRPVPHHSGLSGPAGPAWRLCPRLWELAASQQGPGCPWGGRSPPGAGPAPGSRPVARARLAASLLFLWVLPRARVLGRSSQCREGGPWGDGLPDSPHLSSAGSCSWDLVAALTGGHRAVLAIRPKARVPGAASTCRSDASGHPPLAPRPLLSLGVPLRVSTAGRPEGRLLQCWGGTLLLGMPVNQGHPRAREPSGPPRKRARWDPPQAQPQHEQGQTRPGPEPRPLRASGGPAQGGRQERGPKRRPGRAAAPEEQARAGAAVPLSRLITIHIHFRIERVVEQSPTLKRKPHLGLSPPPWLPASRDVGPPKTR